MKALYLSELYNVPARMIDIPLYVKNEDEKGNMHIYVYDHASLTNGYVKVKALCEPVPYKGRFGVGFTVELHNYNSTRYALKAYYVEVSNSTVCYANECASCPLHSTDEGCNIVDKM